MESSILFHHFRGRGGFGAGTRQAVKPGTAETPVKRSGTASEEVGGEGLPSFLGTWDAIVFLGKERAGLRIKIQIFLWDKFQT